MTTATKPSGHFRITQKAQEQLGMKVLSVLQHVVLIRTNKGPRFISRKYYFDAWEIAQRRSRARGCIAQKNGEHSWLVFDPHTESDHHIVIQHAMNTSKPGYYSCTCADAYFQHERGIAADAIQCKHIIAATMWQEKVK